MLAQLLHAGALGATAIGACCLIADRRRPRVQELLAAVVMTAAMIDVVLGLEVVPAVAWAAVIIVLALVGSVTLPRRASGHLRTMRATDSAGAIVMAALLVLMGAAPASAGAGGGGHHAAASGSWLIVAITAGAFVYAVAAGVAAARSRARWVGRIPPAAMGASVLLMAGAVLA